MEECITGFKGPTFLKQYNPENLTSGESVFGAWQKLQLDIPMTDKSMLKKTHNLSETYKPCLGDGGYWCPFCNSQIKEFELKGHSDPSHKMLEYQFYAPK